MSWNHVERLQNIETFVDDFETGKENKSYKNGENILNESIPQFNIKQAFKNVGNVDNFK